MWIVCDTDLSCISVKLFALLHSMPIRASFRKTYGYISMSSTLSTSEPCLSENLVGSVSWGYILFDVRRNQLIFI